MTTMNQSLKQTVPNTSQSQNDSQLMAQGVALALLSNVLFSVLYIYSGFLAPMTGTQVFIWRVLGMLVFMLAYLGLSGQWRLVVADLRVRRGLKGWLMFLLPTPIFLGQMWLFMWAPINNQGVAVAMGYFLFPLAMVLSGCLLFKERLNGLQSLAVLLAAVGVGSEIIQGGNLSWATFAVCLTYPIYYIMRRVQGVRAVTGLFVDVLAFLPIALAYLWLNPASLTLAAAPVMLLKVLGLGLISVAAFLANLSSVRLLPVSLFGMLSYLEPLLLFVLAITVLGEPLTAKMLFSYGFIWAGIACLIIQGVKAKRGA